MSGLGSGRLIDLPISIATDAKPGLYPLDLSSVVISDPDGQPVTPTLLADGSVEVIAGPPAQIPLIGPFGTLLLACLIIYAAVRALRHPNSLSYRILLLFILANFTLCSFGILPALAALPGDCDDDGDIDTDDIQLAVEVILERSTVPGDPDCNEDDAVNVLDLPCQLQNTGNSPPDLLPPGNREITVNTAFSSYLFAVDPDAGDILSFFLSTAPASMTCDSSTGNLQWEPLESDIGSHTVTARVTDQKGMFDSETFTIQVNQTLIIGSGNLAPDLLPLEDQDLVVGNSLDMTASATDPDEGDTLTFSLPRGPAGMTIGASSGQIEWRSGADQVGSHDVTVKVVDNGGLADTEAFVVTVSAQNASPTAIDDMYVAHMGEALTVEAPGILENDTDPDGDPLQAILVEGPDKGTLNLNSDGSFDYTATAPKITGNFKDVNLAFYYLPDSWSNAYFQGGTAVLANDARLDTSCIIDYHSSLTEMEYRMTFVGGKDATVREIRIYGNRGDLADGHDIYSGRIRLYNASGTEIFDSGIVDFPEPDRDAVIVIPDGPVANVHKLVFTSDDHEGTSPGFSEIELINNQEALDVVEEWSYTSETTTLRPDCMRVTMTPAVADINADGIPDIIFGCGTDGLDWGYLRAISGADGSDIFIADHESSDDSEDERINIAGGIAVGDIDLDGVPEIIAGAKGMASTGLKAFRYDTATDDAVLVWTTDEIPLFGTLGGPSLADLDGDGFSEIIMGTPQYGITVFNHDGTKRWCSKETTGLTWGALAGNIGGCPFAVDLDLDGTMEILAGRIALSNTGELLWDTDGLSLGSRDCGNAVGNFDDDPYPEIVFAGFQSVFLVEHDGTLKWGPVTVDSPGANVVVADLDGDGWPEIGMGGFPAYTAIDTDGTIMWKQRDIDGHIGAANSSAFDFDGDGAYEVVYTDDHSLVIIRGTDSEVLFRTWSTHWTYHEYPVIADVDADGHAEIITGSNPGGMPNPTEGIQVYGGPNDDWPPTRKIWNQHAYHVTNVNDDLTIPSPQQYNWLMSDLNNFRANTPYIYEEGSFDRFTYKAGDGLLESNEATVLIDIQPPNAAPVIFSEPKTNATAGFVYTYWVVAQDPDKDPLTYSLTTSPTGMTIDPLVGKVSWEPGISDLGDRMIIVSVADDKGGVTAQNFTLTVAEPVIVPEVIGETQTDAESQITSAGLEVGTTSEDFHISVPPGLIAYQSPAADTAVESGAEVDLVLSLGPAPEDVDDDNDGFTENEGDCKDADGSIHPGAEDPAGDGIDQDCDGLDGNLTISAILILPASDTLLVGDGVAARAIAVFEDGTSQQITSLASWNSLDPAKATVDGGGNIKALGSGSVTMEASLKGVTGSAVFDILDQTAGDVTPPIAVITSPETNTIITAPTDIIGTANDDNFLKYTLSIAPAGETDFTLLHTGSTPAVDDVLFSFDPTQLINDLYTLRLTVYDTGGNISTTESVCQVDGNLKVGLFTMTFVDLQIPMAGLPIKVTRTYDSRDKKKGDFGIGWRLGVQTLHCRSNRLLGTAWQVYKSSLAYQIFPSDTHKVSITLPDGKVEAFDMNISPNPSVMVPFTSVNAGFQPRPGTVGTLECLDDTALLVVGAQPGDVTLTEFGGNTFDPQNFRYTTVSGIKYEINKTDGVKSITDENGNTLTFGPGGIIHSAGQSVLFTRDALDRITSITDPNGNIQTYSYDGNGDLHSHTDAESNTTRFFYNYQHGLLRIEDPLGRAVARNEYDADGRLVAVVDGNGNRIEYTHTIGSMQEVVKDRTGGITIYEYDQDGNVTRQTDPLGNTTTYAYDANGNKTSRTDPLGHTTTYTYDANNIETSKTDPLGNTIFYNVNTKGELLDITDPEGHVTAGTYDISGNPTTKTGPDGALTTFMYDAAGNRISKKDCSGNTFVYAYDASGNLTKMTDPLGNIFIYTYDANGNRISETRFRTTPSGVVPMTTTYAYNGRNQQIRITDPYGNSEVTEYNAVGKKSAFTDKNGNRTTYEYDVLGNLTRTVFPDGSEETNTYNASGIKLSSTDRGGRTTVFEYDALNRPTRTVKPDGSSIRMEYDSAGRLVARIDENGNRTEHNYDYAGRLVKTTDGLGNETIISYDKNGNKTSVTDPNGHTITYAYDGYDRVIKTTLADGTFTETGYVQGCADIKERVTDANGNTTFYEYDALNRLIKVIDAMGGETTYLYDEVGNRISQTDANGHVTRFEYDHLGRLTKRILPLGMIETFAYDAASNRVRKTDFNGDTITYTYDSSNRLTGKTYPDADTVTFTHTPTGQRASVTDARGVTNYTYDALNRLTNVTQPDGASVSYSYDAKGNRISMTAPAGTTQYTYDALDRLQSVIDQNSRTTTYTCDGAGRRTGIQYPNNSNTQYTYDTLNRLTAVMHRKGDSTLISSYSYTLDANGNRVQVTEGSGWTVDYVYDALNRLVREDISDPVSGNQTINYSYDPAGNRISKTDTGGTTIYDYDANDRLISAGTVNYTYDGNGNQTAKISGVITETYTHNYDNRLAGANTAAGNMAYTYDADGLRVGSIVNGTEANILLDTNRPFAQVIEERNGTGALVANYTYGGNRISQDRSGDVHYYLTDALGSARTLVDASENTVASYTYDGFGNMLNETGTVANPFRFAGEQLDAGLEQYYLRARYYNPRTGRFTSQDPRFGDTYNPISLHRYQYANANPVMYVDPSGEITLMDAAILTAIISGPMMIMSQLITDITLLMHHDWTNWHGSIFVASVGSGLAADTMGVDLESECRQFSETENLKNEALVYVIVTGVSAGFLPVGINRGSTSFATPRGVLSEYYEKEEPSWLFMGASNFQSATIAYLTLPLSKPSSEPSSYLTGFSVTNITMGLGQGTSDLGFVKGLDASIDLMWGVSYPVYGKNRKCLLADTPHASDDVRKK